MVKDSIKIKLNGKESQVQADQTLQDLLGEMKIAPQMVACEVNQKIIKRAEYPKTLIHEGDNIEIIQMIGGG